MLVIWLTLVEALTLTSANSASNKNDTITMDITRKARTDDLSSEDTLCTNGWIPYGDKIYRIEGGGFSEELTWEKASQNCAEYGGHLASIHSKEEQEFLVAHILLNAQKSAWIGLNDRLSESRYQWEDGSAVDFMNWANTEPSGVVNEEENCTEMAFYHNEDDVGKWNDVNCNELRSYICQITKDKKKLQLINRKCVISNGKEKRFRNSCFYLVRSKKSWTEAEDYCSKEYNGHLVAITDFTVAVFVKYILQEWKFVSDVWIGVRAESGSPILWSSGWQFSFSKLLKPPTKDIWDLDEQDSCVLMLGNGQWEFTFCNQKFEFICEASSENPSPLPNSLEGASCPKMPTGWKDIGGHYCYYIEMENLRNWYEANFYCMRRGGTLTSIHSVAEFDALKQFIRFENDVWIGLFRNTYSQEGFGWADNSKLDFTYWRLTEPNSKSEYCVEMLKDQSGWNDNDCKFRNGYICSVKKVLPNMTTSEKEDTCSGGLSTAAILGVVACVLLMVVLMGIFYYYFQGREQQARKTSTTSIPAVEAQAPTRYRRPEQTLVVKDEPEYENTW